MIKKVLFGLLCVLVIAMTLVTACATTTTTKTSTAPTTTTQQATTATTTQAKPPAITSTTSTSAPPVTTASKPAGNWWDKWGEPKYGGMLTIRVGSLTDISFDPGDPRGFQFTIYHERLITRDWTIDPSICAFKVGLYDVKTLSGALAQSWEYTDPQTVVLHLRQGVYWEKKEPVNGRELTSADVTFLYDRMLGIGSGYTKPNPFWGTAYNMIEKATAIDKNTVSIKFKTPSALGFFQLVGPPAGIGAPEVAKLYATDKTDVRNAVGTGPFLFADFVPATSLTMNKNPNYWGNDERHPKNKLPYVDTIKWLAVPDISTALAALRTGKVDYLDGAPLAQAQLVTKSNPEINQFWLPASGSSVNMRVDMIPFKDIRIRKALQMAIDNKSIAQSLYLGTVDGSVCGPVNPNYKGWCTPYSEWPQALKDEYTFNPTGAKAILKEAGFPQGFNTNVVASIGGPGGSNMEILQTIKAYLSDIGVNMEIRIMDPVAYTPFTYSGKHDQMCASWGGAGSTWEPWGAPLLYLTTRQPENTIHHNDANFDALYDKMFSATTMDEVMKASREADLYAIQKHWTVYTCPYASPYFVQPWIKGCNGEVLGSMNVYGGYLARFWINKD